MTNYHKVKLSELISQDTETERITDMKKEHYITLSSYGKGAHERIIKDGKYPVPFLGYRVSAGQFIYSRIDARNGAYDIIPSELDGYVVSKDFPVYDINTSKVLPKFLLYSVLSQAFLVQVMRSSFGATNRMRIKEEIFEEYSISLPSIEEQQRIIEILENTQAIIRDRQQELLEFDRLIKARFVEMFGDLANPECKWDRIRLVEACADKDDIKCGPFGTQLGKDEYTAEGVAVWEIPQINSGFKSTPSHFITQEKAEQLNAYSLLPGDIAMSRKGNVGKCALFPDRFTPGIIHSDVLRIRVDSARVDPVFMMSQLHYSRAVTQQIDLVSNGAIMAGVNVTKLKQIYVHLPPLVLQQQFGIFVAQVDKSKVVGMNHPVTLVA